MQADVAKFFPQIRDIGMLCFNALEEAKRKKITNHGGSLIRAGAQASKKKSKGLADQDA
jgi:hypothetical protein